MFEPTLDAPAFFVYFFERLVGGAAVVMLYVFLRALLRFGSPIASAHSALPLFAWQQQLCVPPSDYRNCATWTRFRSETNPVRYAAASIVAGVSFCVAKRGGRSVTIPVERARRPVIKSGDRSLFTSLLRPRRFTLLHCQLTACHIVFLERQARAVCYITETKLQKTKSGCVL